jgi:hypothetical protein
MSYALLQCQPNSNRSKGKLSNIIKCTLFNNEYDTNLGKRHPNQHKYNEDTDPQHLKTIFAASYTVAKKQRKLQNS